MRTESCPSFADNYGSDSYDGNVLNDNRNIWLKGWLNRLGRVLVGWWVAIPALLICLIVYGLANCFFGLDAHPVLTEMLGVVFDSVLLVVGKNWADGERERAHALKLQRRSYEMYRDKFDASFAFLACAMGYRPVRLKGLAVDGGLPQSKIVLALSARDRESRNVELVALGIERVGLWVDRLQSDLSRRGLVDREDADLTKIYDMIEACLDSIGRDVEADDSSKLDTLGRNLWLLVTYLGEPWEGSTE